MMTELMVENIRWDNVHFNCIFQSVTYHLCFFSADSWLNHHSFHLYSKMHTKIVSRRLILFSRWIYDDFSIVFHDKVKKKTQFFTH